MDGSIPDCHVLGNPWHLDDQRAEIFLGLFHGIDRNDSDQGNLYHSSRRVCRRRFSRADMESTDNKAATEASQLSTSSPTHRRSSPVWSVVNHLFLLGKLPELEWVDGTIPDVSSVDKNRHRCRRTRQA